MVRKVLPNTCSRDKVVTGKTTRLAKYTYEVQAKGLDDKGTPSNNSYVTHDSALMQMCWNAFIVKFGPLSPEDVIDNHRLLEVPLIIKLARSTTERCIMDWYEIGRSKARGKVFALPTELFVRLTTCCWTSSFPPGHTDCCHRSVQPLRPPFAQKFVLSFIPVSLLTVYLLCACWALRLLHRSGWSCWTIRAQGLFSRSLWSIYFHHPQQLQILIVS